MTPTIPRNIALIGANDRIWEGVADEFERIHGRQRAIDHLCGCARYAAEQIDKPVILEDREVTNSRAIHMLNAAAFSHLIGVLVRRSDDHSQPPLSRRSETIIKWSVRSTMTFVFLVGIIGTAKLFVMLVSWIAAIK